MRALGSVEAVLAAIQDEAQAEAERAEREAAAAAAALREQDAHAPVVVADADLRIAAARRRAHEQIAEQDWADRQGALTAREAWMSHVAAAGRKLLLELDAAARQDDLRRLAREAIDRIGADRLELLVSARDVQLLDPTWLSTVSADTGRTLSVVASGEVADGGCIARTGDGRIRFDNTYAGRARRFESAWRARIGALFDRATVQV